MKRQFKFTRKSLDALQPDTSGAGCEYSDTEVAGLRITQNALNRKTWLLRYTFHGRKRSMKLGEYPGIDVAEARMLASEARAQIARGIDPQQTRAQEALARSITLGRFMQEDALPHFQTVQRSYRDTYGRWIHHLKPLFNDTPLTDIRTQDVQRMHDALRVKLSPATANRVLALLKRVCNLAIMFGKLEKNPCRGIRMHPENNHRQRFLAGDELRRFMLALECEPNQTAASLFKFLLALGVRRGEALTAKFSDMSLETATWRLRNVKNNRARTVYLNDVALEIIKRQRMVSRWDWVFPARDGRDAHMADPRKAFSRVVKRAEISGVVIHTLRHSFISAVALRYPLQTAGNLAGQRILSVTARYAHAQEHQLREASGMVSGMLQEAMAQAMPASSHTSPQHVAVPTA